MEKSLIDDKLKLALINLISQGYQIDAEAYSFIKEKVEFEKIDVFFKNIIEKINKLPEKPLMITKNIIENFIELEEENDHLLISENIGGEYHPYAKDVKKDIKILDDPTEKIGMNINEETFFKYFKDRLYRLRSILKERRDTNDTIPIARIFKISKNTSMKIIGIITEKIERTNSISMQIEDDESLINVIVSQKVKKEVYEKARRIFLDQVACIKILKKDDNLFLVEDILNPDIPEKRPNTSHDPVFAVLTSDLHIGSNKFLEKNFELFIDWLNGKNLKNFQKEIVSKVKYIIIAGDLVDGIGIYPNQEKELKIKDIYKQYSFFASLIDKIPEYIEIIAIPGNHDATRQALPQPAIFRDYAEPIYEQERITMIGNPSRISLHGVEFLVYHGRSLDDVITMMPDLSYKNLIDNVSSAMRYLLKIRHLAPVYGEKTPISPEFKDFLVIENPPDVFHSGHVHIMGYEMYKSVLIINSGAWQSQTEFQEKMGVNPTPGVVPLLDLQSLKIMPITFI